ncbi:Chlorophyllase enzyme [Actinokineospora alba]|uniref:Chlorophyllase enzyme n=1 Tax=Actinokineospora alba TaxID=504798 RepID=A0A1H0LRG1_9PSEU|nr:acetylxylan esterase [Actinokineospora alba]TDP67426.1 chlorophyllase-like protein [Actinokineospora alba]SDI97078.1 Chlorophyllase enzyme [Actinokineospora alba]SDO70812.1 Chlorophyllase enzyme [Actinokineospora alba]
MRKRLIALGFVAAIAAAVPVVGQAAAAECPPAPSDWAAAGPFPVTVEAGGSAHTIYRPTQLGGCGAHAVIIWGNGTWATPSSYDALLRHFASHGFIVAAAKTTQAGSGREMLAGLDYLATRNNTAGDVYAGKVDLTRVGATGHSQGGGGAIAAGADPRVDTVVPIEPGPQGDVAALHGPTFFLAGQNDQIVVPSQLVYPRYQKATHIPAVYGELAGAGHFTAGGNGGGFRGPVTAWFRAELLADANARTEFSGADCGYCDSPVWSRFERNALAG